jgi:hypothetical protein
MKSIWQLYFLSKIIYMFFALFVYQLFTQLGDNDAYLSGEPFVFKGPPFSTSIILFLGSSLSFLFGKVFANIPFVLLSFYGVYHPIKKLSLNTKQLITLLSLLSFPNFGIWTSIASKEAIMVFSLGLILGFLIDLIKKNKKKNYLLFFIGLVLCFIFKYQYLIGVTAATIFIILHNTLKLKRSENLFILILIIIGSLIFLVIFKNKINELALEIPIHFIGSSDVSSTRTNTIFLKDFDVFWNAPYGMFISFFGPTLTEALSKGTHLMVFLESTIIVSLFFYTLLKLYIISLNTKRLNIYYLGIFFIILIWILFVNYPMGILNPGSAIRYRQGFYSFIVILYYFFYTEILKSFFILNKK